MELLDIWNDMATMRETLSDKRLNAQLIFLASTKKTCTVRLWGETSPLDKRLSAFCAAAWDAPGEGVAAGVTIQN
jgi:hypothetical protein